MRGKRAKLLRKQAAQLVKDLPPEQNEYRQDMNCISWKQAFDPDGKPMFDGDGTPLIKPYNAPGTLHHMQPFMIMYKIMKKRHYQKRARARGSI